MIWKVDAMERSQGEPVILLFVGGFCLLLAVVSAVTGKAWLRNGSPVLREDDPTGFWVTVAGYCVGFLLSVGYFCWRVYGAPR